MPTPLIGPGRPRRRGFDETSRRGYCNGVISRVASSFALFLILLTVLGHACELPIGAMLAAHAHDATDEASQHHPEVSDAACDAVLAIHRTTQASFQPDAVVQAPVHTVVRPVAPPAFATAVRDSHAVHRRPPLFLLHSALLI
jgi:hypothetical protein